jgi:chromosomal replication initiator protein
LTTGLFTLPLPAAQADLLPLRDGSGAENNAFFAGPENVLVRSLVQLVDTQLVAANPLVFCGPSGVGKSSLALGLAARRRERFDLESVIVTTGADFARSLADAIETDSAAEHRAQHQRCDLLVIDDLHRLANKSAAQQFLISTLDWLQKRGSLVIVTLNRLPPAVPGLTPALVSRLMGGLVVRLALPGPQARRELVRQTALRMSVRLGDDEIDRVARVGDQATDDYLSAAKVRQLVMRLATSVDVGVQPDPVKQNKTLCRRVTTLVAKHCALAVSDLRGKSRRQAVADGRGLAMYLVRRLTSISYAEIGQLFGDRDHTTVLHACRKVEAQLKRDSNLKSTVDELLMQLGAEGAF